MPRFGRTRITSSRKSGVTARSCGSMSASANRMRLAQAEDSASTVILPLFKVIPFTLFANSGPRAFVTVTCHSDASGVERARWARAGRRAEIKSRTVRGAGPGRTGCLSRGGLLGIVSRLLGLVVLPLKDIRGSDNVVPARCKPLMNKDCVSGHAR